MGAQLSQTQIVLLKILACSLKNQKYTSEDFVDYWELYNESSSQTVLLQTISALDTEKISDAEIRKKWTNAALNQLGMNLKIHSQHGYVHKVMRDNDIDYCILKGSASASFYPRPLLRTMGDVDFLVRESDVLRGEGAFRRDGFMPWQEQHECHVVLKKDNVLLEMHFAPAGMPAGKNGKIIAEYLDDIFSKTELITVENTTFLRPSSFHHGLILLMHIYHHLLEEGIGLRHLCDWALWINSVDEWRIEQEFKEKLLQCGLWKFFQILSCLAYKYLDVPYQKWMGDINNEVVDGLMEDIFCGGNFGCKNPERAREGWAISNRGKNGISENKFVQLFHTINSIAEKSCPKLFKIPILKYFWTIFFTVRYFFRVLIGKRENVNIKSLLSVAEKRKELYKNFHLFETEKK